MKQVLLLLSIVLLFFTTNTNAQLKPAQSQYLVEKGVLINPSFEQGYKGWIITGCTKSLVTETPYLDKSLKLTCTNETFSIKQVSTALTSFSKQQGAFDLQIKTTASGVNVSSITNGVRDNVYSVINSTEFKRFKEIGFIVGDTDNGIEVYSDTNFTGEIVLDNVKLGLGNLTQEIGTAHFVGSQLMEGCFWSKSTLGTGVFSEDLSCVYTNTGNTEEPQSKTPAISIPNVRTDGTYRVEFGGMLYAETSNCTFSLSSSTDFENQATSNISEIENRRDYTLSGDFRFDTSGTKTVNVIVNNNFGTSLCRVFADGGASFRKANFSVHFFPNSKNTIVSQDTELTAKTANEFSALVSNTGIVSQENYDWITGDCTNGGAGLYSCNLNAEVFTQPPNCQITRSTTSGTAIGVIGQVLSTSTNLDISLVRDDRTKTNTDFYIHCSKQGADVNKSQTIVGSFEQIRSDDLVVEKRFMAIDYSSSVIDVPSLRIENLDTNKYYDITLNLVVIFGSNSTCSLQAYDNGNLIGQNKVAQSSTSTPEDRISQSFVIPSYRPTTSTITFNLSDQGACNFEGQGDLRQTYVVAAEQATKESIVANLISSQTTRCQTKILSASVATIGIVTDLSFNNLTIGKKYTAQLQSNSQSGSFIRTVHNGVSEAQTFSNSNHSITSIAHFTATASSVTFEKQTSVLTNGNGEKDQTWARLCELPDTVIETTEFN